MELSAAAPPRELVHGGNKAGVIKLLVKYYQESKGLVDEDPHSPRPCLLEQFKEEERCDEYGLVVLAYQEKGNRLIVLCPRLEEWILEAAKEAGVDVEDYGLPEGRRRVARARKYRDRQVQRACQGLSEEEQEARALSERLRIS